MTVRHLNTTLTGSTNYGLTTDTIDDLKTTKIHQPDYMLL